MKLNKNGSFACDTNCTKLKTYRICIHTIVKRQHLEKVLGLMRSNQAQFSDLVAADVSKNTGNSVKKQRKE